jgi:hypothetical protein
VRTYMQEAVCVQFVGGKPDGTSVRRPKSIY